MSALPVEERNNVVPFEVIKKENKQPKLKNDGTEKKTPNNNKEDRWVHPIRNKDDIKKILEYLHEKTGTATRMDTMMAAYRNELLFAIGINVGLRVSDLITLKWENIFESDMKTFREASTKIEQKTGKSKNICPNKCMQKYVLEYLKNTGIEPKEGEYVFIGSRKDKDGKYQHIQDGIVEKMMKDCTKAVGLNENYNTHSLRKTFAYHKFMMYVEHNDPMALVKVQKDLNHRNSSDTARYLGITREESIKSSMELGEYWDL